MAMLLAVVLTPTMPSEAVSLSLLAKNALPPPGLVAVASMGNTFYMQGQGKTPGFAQRIIQHPRLINNLPLLYTHVLL